MKTQLIRDLFRKLYKQGTPIQEISRALHISKRTCNYWAKEMKFRRNRAR